MPMDYHSTCAFLYNFRSCAEIKRNELVVAFSQSRVAGQTPQYFWIVH